MISNAVNLVTPVRQICLLAIDDGTFPARPEPAMFKLHNRFIPHSHHERLIVERAFDIVQIFGFVLQNQRWLPQLLVVLNAITRSRGHALM